jgi:hypothetical protein
VTSKVDDGNTEHALLLRISFAVLSHITLQPSAFTLGVHQYSFPFRSVLCLLYTVRFLPSLSYKLSSQACLLFCITTSKSHALETCQSLTIAYAITYLEQRDGATRERRHGTPKLQSARRDCQSYRGVCGIVTPRCLNYLCCHLWTRDSIVSTPGIGYPRRRDPCDYFSQWRAVLRVAANCS